MCEITEEIEGGLEILDLGDVTVETKQWSDYPIWFDAVFTLGEKDV